MATTRELIADIEEKRQALRQAIEGAGGQWEVAPGQGEWTPRQTAEHAISMERMYAGLVAEALQRPGPPGQELALASELEAVRAFEAAIQDCSPVLAGVTDGDLAKPSELRGDLPSPDTPETVEGVLSLIAFHLDDHTTQIVEAS